LLAPGGDNARWETMWLHMNWAECAAKKPGPDGDKSREFDEQFQNARKVCEQLEDQTRKKDGLELISKQRQRLEAKLFHSP
jgi:hypothetical protein